MSEEKPNTVGEQKANGETAKNAVNVQEQLQSQMYVAYKRLLDNAASLSQLAPHGLHRVAFGEILRHLLENERNSFLMQLEQMRRSQLEKPRDILVPGR